MGSRSTISERVRCIPPLDSAFSVIDNNENDTEQINSDGDDSKQRMDDGKKYQNNDIVLTALWVPGTGAYMRRIFF